MELFPLGPIPERLRCSFCDDLAREPFKLPCCPSKTICAKCKREKPTVCVVCRKPLGLEQCQEHKSLKTTVQVFLKREEKKWKDEMEKNGTPVFTSTIDSQEVTEEKILEETKVGNERTEENRKAGQSSSSLKVDENVINQDVIKGAEDLVGDPTSVSVLPLESLKNTIGNTSTKVESDHANIDLNSPNQTKSLPDPAQNSWNQSGIVPPGANLQNGAFQQVQSGRTRLQHGFSGSPQNIMTQPHMGNPMIQASMNQIIPQQFDPSFSNDPNAWYSMNRGFPGMPPFNPMMGQSGGWNNGNGFPMAPSPYGFFPGQQFGSEQFGGEMSFGYQQDYSQQAGYFEANGGYADESFAGYAPVQNFTTNERGRGAFRGTRGGFPRASAAQEIIPTGQGVEGAPTAPAALRKDSSKLAASTLKNTTESQDLFKNVPKGPKAMMQRGRGGCPTRGVLLRPVAVQGKGLEGGQASRSKSPGHTRRRSPSVVRDKEREMKYRSLSRSKSPSASTSKRSKSKSKSKSKSRSRSRSRSRSESMSRSRSLTPKVVEKKRSRSKSRSPKGNSRRRSRHKRNRSRSTSRHRNGKRRHHRSKDDRDDRKSRRHDRGRERDSRRSSKKSEDEHGGSAKEQEGRKSDTPDYDNDVYLNSPDDEHDSAGRKTRDEGRKETERHGRKKSRSKKARYEDEKFIEENAERDREASRWKR